MNIGLRIHESGPSVTLQDGGRHGYLRYGVTGAGPMDRFSFAVANLAVGVPTGATAIEISLAGLELAAEGAPLNVAVVGGSFQITLEGKQLPSSSLVRLEPDARLKIRAGEKGSWCYLAVSGRIDIPSTLGSVSTHTRSGLGGLDGRGLMPGDFLPIRCPRVIGSGSSEILVRCFEPPIDQIRVVLGPQDDFFSRSQIDAFLAGPWTLSVRSDRMGYSLEGIRLTHARGFNIVSDGIAFGAIQVPGSGQPIVLMADRQPTGGYPKIANVIGADIGYLAQLRPGARFGFRAVSIEEAVEARRSQVKTLASPVQFRPLIRTHYTSEFLLRLNLVGGVISGSEIH